MNIRVKQCKIPIENCLAQTHTPCHGITHVLVVATAGSRQRRVRLHTDQGQVCGGAHDGRQATGCEPCCRLLQQGDRLKTELNESVSARQLCTLETTVSADGHLTR